jgi:hypothetical protein
MNYLRLLLGWLGAALLFAAPSAEAAIQCTTFTSPGFTINYTSQTTASTQTYFRVTCSRASGDATSVTYSVIADNGINPTGQNNRAFNAAASLRYDVYVNGTCGTQWKGNTRISDTITWASAADTSSITRDTPYWGCVTTAQTPTNSGLYSDTVSLTLSYPGGANVVFDAPVRIIAPAFCSFTTQPTPNTITFPNYVPFTSPVRTGTTSFAVQCTNQMLYSLAPNVSEGVAAGVRYLLAINATTAQGTGLPQPYTLTVTVPGGQAGAFCGTSGTVCTGTNSHYITITY